MNNSESLLSRTLQIYLQSISYELSDYEKAVLILKSSNATDKRSALMKIAKETSDQKLVEMIHNRYEIKDYARKLFETNDGTYVYLCREGFEDEVLGIFADVDTAFAFQKQNMQNIDIFHISRHKIQVSQDWTVEEVAVCEYKKGQEPEITVYDADMLSKLSSKVEGKEILMHTQKLVIPTPFKKGDIVFFDGPEKRMIGVLEKYNSGCNETINGDEESIVLYLNERGELCKMLFNPYTADLAYSHYDSYVCEKLLEISDILKGKNERSLFQIFQSVRL